MPIEIGLWKLHDGEATPVSTGSLDKEGRLEEVLEKDITILEGYVGVEKVTGTARPISEFKVNENGQKISILDAEITAPEMDHDLGDPDKCDYLVRVEWIKTVSRAEHFWEPGLFANQNTAARLRNTDTITRVEQHFGLSTDGDTAAE